MLGSYRPIAPVAERLRGLSSFGAGSQVGYLVSLAIDHALDDVGAGVARVLTQRIELGDVVLREPEHESVEAARAALGVGLLGHQIVRTEYWKLSQPSPAAVQASSMDEITAKVASDAVAQYEMVKKTGTPIERCTQAGLVTAAFLQAKERARYEQWHKVQHDDCAVAGVPQ